MEQQKVREESTNVFNRSVDDLALPPRASDSLKKAGVLTIGQVVEKLAEGDSGLLQIAGFGQSALTAAKKKLRALEIELPEPPKVEKAEKAEKTAEAAETPEAGE
ncbi:MAG TPA: DNA-directed RNA polymerase subunit alpha C-terminal domain-containing protein [Anaerolineales bacterium]|nr:DNA-directed RNA polymerase subunit alpha C-terminal domain-containing protein [Anaerolineales bacterium]